MVSGTTLAAIGLQSLAAVVSAYGAWRCTRLQKFGEDPRLRALGWFFGLFAASVALHAIWEYQIGNLVGGSGPGQGVGSRGNVTGADGEFLRRFFNPEGTERVTPWLFGHHVLMIASLAVAVTAYIRHRPHEAATVAAFSPLLLLGDLVPLLLGIEAALTLYLATRALVNHIERKSPGALMVAIGFGLFFLGHLVFFLSHRPGFGRQGIGDVLTLVGITLLVQMLPGKE